MIERGVGRTLSGRFAHAVKRRWPGRQHMYNLQQLAPRSYYYAPACGGAVVVAAVDLEADFMALPAILRCSNCEAVVRAHERRA